MGAFAPESTTTSDDTENVASGSDEDVPVAESTAEEGHVDVEVRQRRLQRFYSLPVSTGQNSVLETIREKENRTSDEDKNE